ncbi:MAG TPA: PhzF family phenazine biosynthesis protein [archaeon]|nr:PhzF family phenazine biosynthesis protein [archaeon]
MGSQTYRYRVVDVFTTQPLEGNPLAVFPDARGINDATMQRIAREFNLSETTFVLPASQPDYAAFVRIFTPYKEMKFAGHPTIGTSFVLLDEGKVSRHGERFVLEEKVGGVPIRVEPGEEPMIWLTTPTIQFEKIYDRKICAEALGLTKDDLLEMNPQVLSAGIPNLYVAVRNKGAVDRAWLDLRGAASLKDGDGEALCVFVFTPTPEGAYSRMFAPELGVQEDPATGSATGPLAAYMLRNGLLPKGERKRYVSEQGTKMGRRSLLHIQLADGDSEQGVEVGGHVTPIADGTMRI